ncbi:MAG: BMC domain-containing protein [Synergistaceae bacterium]|nr:BMC domain-containing protein [Synergistaceae bacterium]
MDRSKELRNKRQAVGFIEAEGLPAAIAAADAAVKAANVYLVSRENSRGGGYMTIKVVGEVGAVKAAVEAAKAVSDKVHGTHSVLVIPRPATGVHEGMIWNCNEYTTGIEPDGSVPPSSPKPPTPPVPPSPPAPEPAPEPEPEPVKAPEPEPEIKSEPEAVRETEPEVKAEPEFLRTSESYSAPEAMASEPEVKPEAADNAEEAKPDIPFRPEPVEDGTEEHSGHAEFAGAESGDGVGTETVSKPRRKSRRSKSK